MRIAIITAAVILSGTMVGHTEGIERNNIVLALNVPVAKQGVEQRMSPIPVHSRWTFVACASSPHDCSHHAHDHGFHHHMVQLSHGTCGTHPHLACYGRN